MSIEARPVHQFSQHVRASRLRQTPQSKDPWQPESLETEERNDFTHEGIGFALPRVSA
jgi:hypothetical protein